MDKGHENGYQSHTYYIKFGFNYGKDGNVIEVFIFIAGDSQYLHQDMLNSFNQLLKTKITIEIIVSLIELKPN